MSDVDLGSGYRGLCGVGQEGADAYGTLVAPTELLPFVSCDIKQDMQRADTNMLVGKAWREDNKGIIKKVASGSLVCTADYQALDILFGLVLGGETGKTGASAPYTHTLALSTADIQRSVSLALDKRVEDDYAEGVKSQGMTFTSNPENVGVSFDCIAEEISRGTTHRTALRALVFTLGKRIFHDQGVFRIADCADALAAGDVLDNVSEFELSLSNNLAADHYKMGGKVIAEPYRTGKGEVRLRFTLPRYAANTFVTARDLDTKLQADVIYTGSVLGAGTYSLKFEFPTVKIISAEYPMSDEGLISHVVECECFNNNANTNMSGITPPLLLTIINNRSVQIWS